MDDDFYFHNATIVHLEHLEGEVPVVDYLVLTREVAFYLQEKARKLEDTGEYI